VRYRDALLLVYISVGTGISRPLYCGAGCGAKKKLSKFEINVMQNIKPSCPKPAEHLIGSDQWHHFRHRVRSYQHRCHKPCSLQVPAARSYHTNPPVLSHNCFGPTCGVGGDASLLGTLRYHANASALCFGTDTYIEGFGTDTK
jgi:hypothetical protein